MKPMENKIKEKQCRNTDCKAGFLPFRSTDKYCSAKCFFACEKTAEKKPKPIKQVSDKRKIENKQYTIERLRFLAQPENFYCFIDGCNKRADTIEHTMGRIGYADDWARDNKITLYLDTRFWKPCCLAHNLELENNPELSKKYQLSKIHGGKKG